MHAPTQRLRRTWVGLYLTYFYQQIKYKHGSSGSGYLSAFVAKILEQTARDVLYICTDRNVLAAKATETTGRLNNIILNPLQTDFCAGLVNRLKHSVDLMIFNPPYVVTPSDEIQSSDPIFWSWAGGVDGREVLDRFLDQSLPDVRVPS